MPNVELALPAVIGEEVLVTPDALFGQVAPVVAWQVVCRRFLLGGLLDRTP